MSDGRDLVRNAPALARFAAGTSVRAARWGLVTSVRASLRVARAATDPALAVALVEDLRSDLRAYARDLLGITDLEQRVALLNPVPPDPEDTPDASADGAVPETVRLRVQGARLLQAAARIDPGNGPVHPAYARILTELAPDEGRILRLLATEGAQPAVDIRAASLFGVASVQIAGGLSMVGAQAGCQHRDRVPAYLTNLERLGLVSFSREALGDAAAYQVLEAQPEVLAAIKSAPRAKTVQRRLELTPFGADFCQVCLPLARAEVEQLAGD